MPHQRQSTMPVVHKKENIFSPIKSSASPMPSVDLHKVEMERDLKIMIAHNEKLKQQINQQALDFDALKSTYERNHQDSLKLVIELENLQKLLESTQRESRARVEQIKELQHFIEAKVNSENKHQEEIAGLRASLATKDQEILKLKQHLEEKNLENQEIRNTLQTINQKVQFIQSQKDQQYHILEKFNLELQEDITHKTNQIHQLSQTLSTTQQQLNQARFESDSTKSRLQSQQSQLPLQQLQSKYLVLCTENERLHTVIMQESQRSNEQLNQIHQHQGEIERLQYELRRISEEFTRLQQGLAFEQKNHYLIDDLRRQIANYADENARLNAIIYGK